MEININLVKLMGKINNIFNPIYPQYYNFTM